MKKAEDQNLKKSEVEFFQENFGQEVKQNLGLIDGLGNANEILKEKFGEDVIIKKFEKSKSWLSQKLIIF